MSKKALPESISTLISELSKLPGIGEKNATRLAFHIFRASGEYSQRLAKAIAEAKSRVVTCSICHHFASNDPCGICRDPNRDESILCVVEEPLDLVAIEKISEFRGKYHVLGGIISPLEGIGPEDLAIQSLLSRVKAGTVKEVLIATNTTVEGDTTAMYLAKLLKPLGVRVTRLAHGIPIGGDLEYIDELTLGKALKDRTEM